MDTAHPEAPPAGCRLLELPRLSDPRGSLTPFEEEGRLPFPVRRAFWVYDLAEGATRGGHAHRRAEQLIVCLAGSLTVTVDDGREQGPVRLTSPSRGLHVPPMVWGTVGGFAPGTIYLVLVSEPRDPAEYHTDYAAFLEAARKG